MSVPWFQILDACPEEVVLKLEPFFAAACVEIKYTPPEYLQKAWKHVQSGMEEFVIGTKAPWAQEACDWLTGKRQL